MIKINNLYKSYRHHEVLKGLCLEVPRGKIQSILGRNGSGKSTLLRCVSNVIDYEAGDIFISNISIKADNTYRKHVGYVFDSPLYIDKFSTVEYLTFLGMLYKMPKSKVKQRIDVLLDTFELPHDRKYIESYSGGMKCKVSLAAALLHEPKYLILDEPFNGLDFIACQRFSRILKDIAGQGGTILITSHQFDLISPVSDMFGLLVNGKIHLNVESSSLSHIAEDNNLTVRDFIERELTK
jgi:ABC-2 type transport system ATP-binding protein